MKSFEQLRQEHLHKQGGDPYKFVYRPYKHQLPSFWNRVWGALLYPENNARAREEYGKHYILFPKLQPGAIESSVQDITNSRWVQSML